MSALPFGAAPLPAAASSHLFDALVAAVRAESAALQRGDAAGLAAAESRKRHLLALLGVRRDASES